MIVSPYWRAALLALLPATVLATPAQAESGAPPQPLCFAAWLGGSDIGRHRVHFHRDGERLVAEIAIDLKVGLGPLTLFSYRHRNREVWRDGRLQAISTRTDDDGARYAIDGRADQAGFIVENGQEAVTLPADVAPTSYWREDTMRRGSWLDTQQGRRLDIAIAGAPPLDGAARSYAMKGDLELTVGYDEAGQWRGLRFAARGGAVVYRPCPADEVRAAWQFDLDDVPPAAARRRDGDG